MVRAKRMRGVHALLVLAAFSLLECSVGFVYSFRLQPRLLERHGAPRSPPAISFVPHVSSRCATALWPAIRHVVMMGSESVHDGDEPLLEWAKSKGALVSQKVALRTQENARAVVALEKIEEGETVFSVPTSLALSAVAAREQVLALAGWGLEDVLMWEEDHSDAWLTLWTALALRNLLPDVGWQAYVQGLRDETPDLPALWDDGSLELFSKQIIPRVMSMRKEMAGCVKVCRDVLFELETAMGEAGAKGWHSPSDLELQSAWALVRSRWIRESDSSTGTVSKKLFPVVDFMNHEPSGLSGAAASYASKVPQSRFNNGPAVKVAWEEDQAVFRTTRSIDAGNEVTWSYGKLSNEDLVMVYGFVPAGFVHGDNRLGFSLPSELFRRSLDALSQKQGCSSDLMDRKVSLLQQLGVISSTSAENPDLNFEAYMGEEPTLKRDKELPVALSIIARIMCLTTADELALVCLTTGGETAAINPSNEVRAMRWLTWLLTQIEEQMFAKDVAAVDLTSLGVSLPASIQEARQMSASKILQGEYLVLTCARDIYARKEASAMPLSKKKSKPKRSSGGQNKPKGFGR